MAVLLGILSAIPYGLLLGAIFGPLRLAGVDYSKWFRNPGEVSEGADRTWIGLARQASLSSGYVLLAVAVAGLLVEGARHGLSSGFLDSPARGFAFFAGDVLEFLVGVSVGAIAVQGILEGLWRYGLRRGRGRSLQIRLARPATARARLAVPAPAPVAGRRRLIICCDGTWNSPTQAQETNVVQLLRAIRPFGGTRIGMSIQQMSYYHLGVGTGNVLDRFLGGGAGIGLSSSVKACYGFLVDNFRAGDEILLFGFSRGAYVVRSVAGMIGRVGLLQRHEMFRFMDAWNYYTLHQRDRRRYSLDAIAPERHQDVEISCVGVWDTVGALGIPGTRVCANSYSFHDTGLGPHVHHAFQALAIDERRGNFQPAIWVKCHLDQILEQVWFPGVHSNVGGGYLEHGLSDTTLLWMLSRLKHYDLLDLNMRSVDEAIGRHHAEAPPMGKVQNSRSVFWKAIACPVPRPVGITDDSERVHVTAIDRRAAARDGDLYSARNRQAWLDTIPPAKICPVSDFERDHSFRGPEAGAVIHPIVHPQRGLCDRLVRRLFGQA